MSTADKVIISCALTGAVTTKKHCPAIPYTPEEIAEEAKRAHDAGAAIAHIHAREDSGMPSWDREVFERIITETKKRSPIIINFSTGGAGPMESRCKHLSLKPHVAALNMGSMNYAKYRPHKKDFAFKFVFQNSFDDIVAFIKEMNEHNVKPEMECFDTGHVYSHTVLEDLGLLQRPYHFSFIMGVLGGIPATAQHLAFQARNVPDDARWKVIGISRDQWKMCMAALSLGGDIRVGLEDNFYRPDGEMATSNGDLVDEAVKLTRLCGREPASVEDAVNILWPGGGGNF